MLDFAINHKEKLIETHKRFLTQNLQHCKYYICDNYIISYTITVDENNWSNTQMVSLTNNEVTGYMKAVHDRSQKTLSHFNIISYKLDSNPQLYRDIIRFVDELFKSGIRKIKFSSIDGSPASKINQKLVNKYNGRIIGVSKEDVELIDGKIYDVVKYELFNPHYYIIK